MRTWGPLLIVDSHPKTRLTGRLAGGDTLQTLHKHAVPARRPSDLGGPR